MKTPVHQELTVMKADESDRMIGFKVLEYPGIGVVTTRWLPWYLRMFQIKFWRRLWMRLRGIRAEESDPITLTVYKNRYGKPPRRSGTIEYYDNH